MDSSFLVYIQATRPALRLVFARASWKVVKDSTVDEGEMQQLGSTVAHVNTLVIKSFQRCDRDELGARQD